MLEFVLEVLRFFSLDETDGYDALYWRCEEPGTVRFFVNVNDVFYPSTADLEEITPEDMPALRQAYADVAAITSTEWEKYSAFDLWVARKRKIRPLKWAYPGNELLWPLFDACGLRHSAP